MCVLQFTYNTRHDYLKLGGDVSRLTGFVDSNWAGCKDTRKSVTGFILFLDNGPIAWQSRLQSIVAQSYCCPEYVAVSEYCLD